MNKRLSSSFMTQVRDVARLTDSPEGGFYSKYIYEDLLKIRCSRPKNEGSNNSALENYKINESTGQCSPLNKDKILESSLSQHLDRTAFTCDTRNRVSNNVKVADPLIKDTLMKEKDEHINFLKDLLCKAMDLLGNIRTRKEAVVSPVNDYTNKENKNLKKNSSHINKRQCEDLDKENKRKKVLQNALKDFLKESSEIKAQLNEIDTMISSL